MSAPVLHYSLRRFLLLPLCILLSLAANADDAQRLLLLGDAAYAHKAYDSAVAYYEAAAGGKAPDATALYKLGNAHYRLRHTGEAMLAYERALLRHPGFAPAAKNAHLIQRLVQPGRDKQIFFMRWWGAIAAPETSNAWALVAILLFAAIVGALAWGRYRQRNPGWLRPQITAGAFLLVALFAVLSLSAALRDVPRAQGVIMRPDTKFKPLAGAAKIGGYSLPEGLLVKVLHRQPQQVTIELPDGQEGFVQRADIAIVE